MKFPLNNNRFVKPPVVPREKVTNLNTTVEILFTICLVAWLYAVYAGAKVANAMTRQKNATATPVRVTAGHAE